MKATIEFDLLNEREDFETFMAGQRLHTAVYEFSMYLRNIEKHQDPQTWPGLDAIREEFYKILDNNGANDTVF